MTRLFDRFFVLGLLVLLSLANVGFAVTLSACGTLSTANTTYTLNQTISAAGTCITIGANNITVDGAGYTINYSQSATGYGIDNSGGYDGITIANLSIQKPLGGYSNSHAVYLTGVDNSLFRNINIRVESGSGSKGVYIYSGNRNNILENITVYTAPSSAWGVDCTTNCINNTFTNITIDTIGNYAYGIQIFGSGSNGNSLTDNTIRVNGTTDARGIRLVNLRNTTIKGGLITSLNGNDYSLESLHDEGNTIQNTGFSGSKKIYFKDASWFNFNNNSNVGPWLKTNLTQTPEEATVTRKILGWTVNSTAWNDSITKNVTYQFSGLYTVTNYTLYKNGVNVLNATSDGAGLIAFTTELLGETNLNFSLASLPDTTPPIINLSSPVNTTYAALNLSLNFTVTDNIGISACTYELDGNAYALQNCGNTSVNLNDSFNYLGTADSVSCDGDWAPAAPCANTYDNNLGTSGAPLGTGEVNVYKNYTIPPKIYSYKGSLLMFSNSAAVNTSILDNCISDTGTYQAKINIGMFAPRTKVYCYDYSINGWSLTYSIDTTSVYEFGLYLKQSQGNHTIRVRANDTSNNVGYSSLVYFSVDSYAPHVVISVPTNSTYGSTTVSLNYTVSDDLGVSQCKYELNGGANVSLATCQNTTFTATEGSNTIRVWANDTANNWNVSATVSFTVDTTPPAVSCASCPASSSNPTITFSVTATDLNGVDSVRLFYRGTYYTMTNTSGGVYSYTYTENNNGEYPYQFYVNDSAGNTNSSLSYTIVIGASTSAPPPAPYVPPAPPAPYVPPVPSGGGGGSGDAVLVQELFERIKNLTTVPPTPKITYISRPEADVTNLNLTGLASVFDGAKFDPKRLNEDYVFSDASEIESLRGTKITKLNALVITSIATGLLSFGVFGPGVLFFGSWLVASYAEAFYLANLPLVHDTIKTATVGG